MKKTYRRSPPFPNSSRASDRGSGWLALLRAARAHSGCSPRASGVVTMLIGDDDDYDNMLEETDAALQEEEEPPPVSTDNSSASIDESIDVAALRQGDFALLPFVAELVEAHRAGDAQAAEQKMNALRRAVRRVERRLGALQHAISEPAAEVDAAAALLEARKSLAARTKRKINE